MAQRRMFSLKVIDTDEFIDMPISARLLYYDLSMRADDDGFVASPKKIQRMTGCSGDDLKLLIAKQFLIPFENGVCVIKHWRLHNYISKDRYTRTIYTEEFNKLNEIDGVYEVNQSLYTDCIQDVIPDVIQNVDILSTQVRLGKDRLGKVRLDKDKKDIYTPEEKIKINSDKKQYLEKVFLTDEEYEKLLELYKSQENLDKGLEKLNNYIRRSGKKYDSDYHAMNDWVLRSVTEDATPKGFGTTRNTSQNRSTETDERTPFVHKNRTYPDVDMSQV
jgi:hypothetical protein